MRRHDLYKNSKKQTPYERKIEWLQNRGYEQTADGHGLEITIIITTKNGSAYFKKTITHYDIDNMSYDDLDEYDARVWMEARRDIREFLPSGGR